MIPNNEARCVRVECCINSDGAKTTEGSESVGVMKWIGFGGTLVLRLETGLTMYNRRTIGIYLPKFVPSRGSRFLDVIYQGTAREDPVVVQVCTKTIDAR